MKEIKFYCDHCGKQIDSKSDYIGEEIGIGEYKQVDLCADCVKEFDRMVLSFCKRVKTDE